LFILWFGIGISSKIAVAAVMVFFIVLINTIAGIRSVPAQLLQVARVMGALPNGISTGRSSFPLQRRSSSPACRSHHPRR